MAYMLMAIDFLANIYLAVKIVWVRKKNPDETRKHIDLLQKLSLNERGEFLIPLGFIAVRSSKYCAFKQWPILARIQT